MSRSYSSDHIGITQSIKCCEGDICSDGLIGITRLITSCVEKIAIDVSQVDVESCGVFVVFCRIGIAMLNTKAKPHIGIADKGEITILCNTDRTNYSDINVSE